MTNLCLILNSLSNQSQLSFGHKCDLVKNKSVLRSFRLLHIFMIENDEITGTCLFICKILAVVLL